MLTQRLQKIINLVKQDSSIADIGSDHGLVPVYLLENKISPSVIITDVNDQPLNRAKNLVSSKGLESQADLRLGSGLETLKENEVDQVIIAGMGGDSIITILNNDLEKSHSYKQFILQPMTHTKKLREFLVKNNFKIIKEFIIEDKTTKKERYFNILVVENGSNFKLEPFDLEFGLASQMEKDTNYFNYINYERNKYRNRIEKMRKSDNEKTSRRRLEFERRFNFLNKIYESFENNQNN